MQERKRMRNWTEFVSIAQAYPEHLFKKCPDCGGRLISIPAGDYYDVEQRILMPGDQVCLSCKAYIKAHPYGVLWGPHEVKSIQKEEKTNV